MAWKIPLFKIYWDEEDVEAVTEAIKTGMNWAVGPNVVNFEALIARYVGTKYAVTFNSGTSALHAALLAHGIKQGDEVIVPSFTFIATANAPLFVGAKPVFADIAEETFGLDPEDVKENITKKTKAIIPIHYGGCSCKIRELKEIAEDHNLILIEDAAESLGARIGDKNIGTFGDSAMLSFCQNKIITTGDGGAIVTNTKEIYEKLKLIRSHGRLETSETSDYFSSTEYMDYVTQGYNFRMSNITAALGVAQLKKADNVIEMRRDNAEYLTARLKRELKEIMTPNSPNEYYHVYQMYTIMVDNRDELMKYLADEGIMTKVYFSPVHLTHFYKNGLGYTCELPVTEELSTQVLTLPMYPALTREEIDFILDKIKCFFEVPR
ncbi:perosamine synthetase [Candidatus Methanophagaceae archaeon]|nr:perosamine synthetase [Methanophagales archaeon]